MEQTPTRFPWLAVEWEASALLVDVFNVPPQALAFVNGVEVDVSYRLQANDILVFCKEHGHKGRRRMLTKAAILRKYTGYPADVMAELFATLGHDDVSAWLPAWHEANVDEWLGQADPGSESMTDGIRSSRPAASASTERSTPILRPLNGDSCNVCSQVPAAASKLARSSTMFGDMMQRAKRTL